MNQSEVLFLDNDDPHVSLFLSLEFNNKHISDFQKFIETHIDIIPQQLLDEFNVNIRSYFRSQGGFKITNDEITKLGQDAYNKIPNLKRMEHIRDIDKSFKLSTALRNYLNYRLGVRDGEEEE